MCRTLVYVLINKIFFIIDIFKTVFSINCSNLSCVAFIKSFVLSIESNASLFLQPEQCRISFQYFCLQYVYIDLKVFTFSHFTICEEDGIFLKKCVCMFMNFWNDGHNISTYSTTEATCPPWSWTVYFWYVHGHLLVCQQVTGNHQATLGAFSHSLTQYSWNKIRNATPMRKIFTWDQCLNKNLFTRNKKWLKMNISLKWYYIKKLI